MLHIGISATIKDFEVPFFIGYFKINESQDLRKTASIACKKCYEKNPEKYGENFLQRLQVVEVYDRQTNENLLTINL